MYINTENYYDIKKYVTQKNITLVAVSKTKPVAAIQALYNLGQRDFGENYVQELVEKQAQLPNDIRWHYIGHLQSNKVKLILPIVHLIHGVDTQKLLQSIQKEANKLGIIANCLLQVHIATESTKFGLTATEINNILSESKTYTNVHIKGLMGMASNTTNEGQIATEFESIYSLQQQYANSNLPLATLSIGMSGDYKIAAQHGATMVRIGSLLFGSR